MPTYNFENTKTGEQYSLSLSISEREKYLEDNPDVIQLLTTLNVVDPVGIGVTRPPSDFQKYVLGKVKDVAGAQKSQIEKRWQITKEI